MQTDKRIIKTRTSIKTAFMELVESREPAKISVSDLAARALVNRSTFYLHYSDVSDVARDIENEISDRISSCIGDFSISDIYGSTYSIFKKLTTRLDENVRMKRYIIFSTCSTAVVAKIKNIFVEKTKAPILNKFPNLNEQDIIYPLTYAASGIVDSYVKWVKDNDSSTSPDDVIKKVSHITETIISDITLR